MSKQTLEQRRAAHALARIGEARERGINYRSYVEALPATVAMNGLGQAVATLRSKQKPPHELLHDHLQSWLCADDGPFHGQATLLPAIAESDQRTYVHAQAEALAYLTWLKKFAQAEWERKDD